MGKKLFWFFGMLMAILTALYHLSVVTFKNPNVVVAADDVGEIIGADFLSDGRNKTKVITTKGVYLVYYTFQATKGHSVVLETRENGDRMLCDKVTLVCRELAY